MQAETRHKRFSYRAGKHPDAGKRPVSNRNRNGRAPKKAHPVLGALGTGILSVSFEPYPLTVAGVSVDIPSLESKIDIDESLVNLFDTADNYFSLMGKTLKTKRTGDFRVDIPRLYIEFKGALPKGVEINIDVCQDCLLGFELYNYRYDFPEEFIWFPVDGICKMSEPVAAIFKRFVSFLSSSQEIPFPEQNNELDYILEDPECYACDNSDFIELAARYKGGDIHELFAEMLDLSTSPEEIRSLCDSLDYQSISSKEKDIVDCMRRGIILLEEDCITHYNYRELESRICYDIYEEDIYPVEFNRTVAIVYGSSDDMANSMAEELNCMIREYGCYSPACYAEIWPFTNKLFLPSDYPIRFYRFINDLIFKLDNL